MADEGFHEIQLNGKQLVFLFMAATVVSVVVFLLGVMVGRNVRQPSMQMAATAADTTALDPTADPGALQSSSTGTASDRTPLSAQETLTYAERLEAPEPPVEAPIERVERPAPVSPPIPEAPRETASANVPPPAKAAPAPPVTPARAPVPAPAAVPAVQTSGQAGQPASNEPAGSGYVVQVMAAVKREEAESLARRLTAKGYPAFVSVGDVKVPAKYRVRVGKYTDRREAEVVESRLQKQEQFKTWLVPPTR